MKYAIYPPVGIARVGDSPTEFFIGPETDGSPGLEIVGQVEQPVREYKDVNLRIKRQAARFRIFEDPEDGTGSRPVTLPAGAEIEWTAHLVNRKQAVVRQGGPPPQPRRPQPIANPSPSTIDPGSRSVRGRNASPQRFDNGRFQGRVVPLGEVRTDANQQLLVLGGRGFSSSVIEPPTIGNFYNNPGWHDDTSDGPVTARVHMPNGETIDHIAPAWVVVATPDFAPEVGGVVTLFDEMFQVGVDHFNLPVPAQPSFTHDIFPILERTRRLRWVNSDPTWADVSDDWARLADASVANEPFRTTNRDIVESIESVLSRYRLTNAQKDVLRLWADGTFHADWSGVPTPDTTVTPQGLTRAALGATVGQGFFPGIEAGIILRDPTLYVTPFDFRLDHQTLHPGDLTALMAVPWQADFWECARSWWPSQRPDEVRHSANSPEVVGWDRGITGHISMVMNFSRLGFITPTTEADGTIVLVETQRHPGFS